MEAPFLHIPSINIGSRQSRRLHAISVIDVDYDKNKIKDAILKSISNRNFQNQCKKSISLYGDGTASKKIIKILEDIQINKISIQKQILY